MKTAFATDPQTIDPRKNADIFSSYFQKMIFEGLTRLAEHGNVEMALAKTVSLSDDGLVYRFSLRDAVWSDGTPITAYDFEYTWKQVLDPAFGAPCAFLFYPILNAPEALKREVSLDQLGIRAIDAKTFEVRLSHPTPYFLSLISFCPFFAIPKHIDEKNPNWAAQAQGVEFVCSGPYQLAEWKHNSKFVVKKNPLYWEKKQVFLEGVEVFIVSNEKTVLSMFENGEIDLINSLTTPLSTDELIHLKQSDSMNLFPNGSTSFCTFNLTHPLLQNPKIRKALSLAINRSSIVRHITQMDEEPAKRFVPTTVVATNKALTLMAPYDTALAKKLFAEGMQELKNKGIAADELLSKLTFSYESKELTRRVAQAIQQEWKQVLGFKVELQENDFKTLLGNLERKNYAAALFYWAAHYLDPMSILDRFKFRSASKNYPGYENQEYISLLTQAQNTNDTALRIQLMESAEAVIVNDMPLAPIYHFNQVLLKNKRFNDVAVTPLGDVVFRNVKPVPAL